MYEHEALVLCLLCLLHLAAMKFMKAMKASKRGTKKPPAPKHQVTAREEELIVQLRKEGKSMGDIYSLTGRSTDTISNHTDNAPK